MKTRYLATPIKDLVFSDHKMALVSGPRQCGKTTLARMLLRERGAGVYLNWDDVAFRRIWAKDARAALPQPSESIPVVVFDEIHKAKGWKRTLKGLYDTRSDPWDALVTGSARLNVYKKGGDSLLGRSLHFRMHPFSLPELLGQPLPTCPDERLDALFARAWPHRKEQQDIFNALTRFGGFPDPFLTASDKKARLWRHSRVEKVIREDLRDLSRLPELGRVEMLAALLPEQVGSPLSRTSLREDLEVSYDTVSRWIAALKELYYAFELRPYSKGLARSLKKEGKLYLWDWSEVDAQGPRFENLLACHLLKACDFWTDTGEGSFELTYLRNKEKQEIDFLILRNGRPWMPVEAKLSDTTPAPHFGKFLSQLGCRRGLQIVASPNHFRKHLGDGFELLVISADEAMAYFV